MTLFDPPAAMGQPSSCLIVGVERTRSGEVSRKTARNRAQRSCAWLFFQRWIAIRAGPRKVRQEEFPHKATAAIKEGAGAKPRPLQGSCNRLSRHRERRRRPVSFNLIG